MGLFFPGCRLLINFVHNYPEDDLWKGFVYAALMFFTAILQPHVYLPVLPPLHVGGDEVEICCYTFCLQKGEGFVVLFILL